MSSWNRLLDACQAGDFEAAKQALEDGADPDHGTRNALNTGITPIFLCASNGNRDIAELLIQYNADVNVRNEFDGTICLHYAASNGHPEICKLLLRSGSKVNTKNRLGWTPLMDGAEIGCVEVIDILIKEGADVNMENREQHTALSYCVDSVSSREPQFFDCALRLLEHGANPNSSGPCTGRTLMHCAVVQGNLDLVKKLVEEYEADVRYYDNEGKTALEYAKEQGFDVMERYLKNAVLEQFQRVLERRRIRKMKGYLKCDDNYYNDNSCWYRPILFCLGCCLACRFVCRCK